MHWNIAHGATKCGAFPFAPFGYSVAALLPSFFSLLSSVCVCMCPDAGRRHGATISYVCRLNETNVPNIKASY